MELSSEAGEQAIEDAIAQIEAGSAAEVVVVVRPRARFALIQHAGVAFLSAIGMLAFALFGPVAFDAWQVLLLPITGALSGALLVEAAPPLYRWLSPAWQRYEHVRESACTTFVEAEVHATRQRTGILVYVALRERMVEIVADIGVLEHHGTEVLAAWAGTLEAALVEGGAAFGTQLAKTLGPPLAASLPRTADDTNELPDAVKHLPPKTTTVS
jgi:putative membrane protein